VKLASNNNDRASPLCDFMVTQVKSNDQVKRNRNRLNTRMLASFMPNNVGSNRLIHAAAKKGTNISNNRLMTAIIKSWLFLRILILKLLKIDFSFDKILLAGLFGFLSIALWVLGGWFLDRSKFFKVCLDSTKYNKPIIEVEIRK
jgi:hypothetical protein